MCVYGSEGRLGGWELDAECIFVSCSLWDVKVYIVSVDILGTVHVFISVCECDCVAQFYYVGVSFFNYLFCTHFRSVPVTGNWSFSAAYQKCLYREVCHTCTLLPF